MSSSQATQRLFLSGNEALALAARDAGVTLGTGYPGTPATEILEHFAALGGRAQWSPNEKVALEVALGAAYGGGAAMVAMKHVGLNVAADPLFSAAYTGVPAPLVVVSADDPGMASSQNEQDNRRYAVAAGVPLVEPADSQEAYDFFRRALEISRGWQLPVLLRLTTRVCHSKTVVTPHPGEVFSPSAGYRRDIASRSLIPIFARPAHRRLREKLARIAKWNESSELNVVVQGSGACGVITSGVAFAHVREAAPAASILKLGLTHPLPLNRIRSFAAGVERCVVVEEGDPVLVEQLRAAGIAVEGKPEGYRFGELGVARVRGILAGDPSPAAAPASGGPASLCPHCPHRIALGVLRELQCIAAGDIGCYSLGALPPLEAIDSLVCMGASIGMGLGLRHTLPEPEARRVVSVIGDSTFVHSGLAGLVEMVYNPPATGHVVLVLDNGTTAMTGQQEHPGTGRTLTGRPTGRLVIEEVARAMGVQRVVTIDPLAERQRLAPLLRDCLSRNETAVIVVRRPCLLARRRTDETAAAPPAQSVACASIPEQPAAEQPASNGTDAGSCGVTNVVIAGLGGQGILKAADVLARAAFLAGFDVKEAGLRGISQRGGSVTSDVRFGPSVLSPMVPPGEADFLLALAAGEVEGNRSCLRTGGRLIAPDVLEGLELPGRRGTNIALLGALSRHLPLPLEAWRQAIVDNFALKFHEPNLRAFDLGRSGSAG